MDGHPVPYDRIVFVCTNVREHGPRVSCGDRGGIELRERLKQLVRENGLAERIRICKSGCMDVCEEGPNLIAFPDQQWLCGASPDDAEEIFARLREGIG